MAEYLTQNTMTVTINGETYEARVPFPMKASNLLDEQLDEGYVAILQVGTEIFSPQTPVTLTITNEKQGRTLTFDMEVATDKAEESPPGSKKYNHEIYLIERTKDLEGFISRSHGYVNDSGRIYTENAKYIEPTSVSSESSVDGYGDCKPNDNLYKSPIVTATEFKVHSIEEAYSDFIASITLGTYKLTKVEGKIIVKGEEFSGGTITPPAGILTIVYDDVKLYRAATGMVADVFSGTAQYDITVVSNVEPLPKWNARTVIERALVVAETIRKSDTQRYKLDEEQASILEKIETPEFQFSQSTLREVLQGIGSYIHAEPRLINGNTIHFDFYGGNELNTAPIAPYASLSVQQDIEQYCTSIDSSTNNLVNTLDYAKGVLVEPYAHGYKTLRTESTYYMLSEGNAEISTQQRIQEVIKVECGFVDSEGKTAPPIDITPYVYEEADYNRLSSYSGTYPGSKAYGIYYTQGSSNIKGLFFKQDHPVSEVFSHYAIVNILQAVTGNKKLTIDNNLRLAFRVTYRPIFNARIRQSKSNLETVGLPRMKAYGQGQNLIETTYYGEHLKGVVARLGNVSKTITYVRPGLAELPKVGTLYNDGNDDYYISVVAAEFYPYVTKVSVALSKDFNRYSEFIGINSLKRMYEVSEKQAYDSDITYADYVVIGDKVEEKSSVLYNTDTAAYITNIFTQNNDFSPITLLIAQGYDEEMNKIESPVALPVMTAAMGNSVIFVSNYKDNYSAGNKLTHKNYTPSGETNAIDGYFTDSVPYSDVHGNIEYLGLNYYGDGTEPSDMEEQSTLGDLLPSGSGVNPISKGTISTGDDPLWIKKGSTEVLSINYQIDFVTNRKDIIIGSALAQNCSFVGGTQFGHGAVLYVLPRRLNKFDSTVDLTDAEEIYDYNKSYLGKMDSGVFYFEERLSTITGKSWAMVDKVTNALLIGCNTDIEVGANIFDGLCISFVHKF